MPVDRLYLQFFSLFYIEQSSFKRFTKLKLTVGYTLYQEVHRYPDRP